MKTRKIIGTIIATSILMGMFGTVTQAEELSLQQQKVFFELEKSEFEQEKIKFAQDKMAWEAKKTRAARILLEREQELNALKEILEQKLANVDGGSVRYSNEDDVRRLQDRKRALAADARARTRSIERQEKRKRKAEISRQRRIDRRNDFNRQVRSRQQYRDGRRTERDRNRNYNRMRNNAKRSHK